MNAGAIPLGKEDTNVAKALKVHQVVSHLYSTYDVKRIVVEDFMKTFQVGKFHTQGLFRLAEVNGMIKYACFLELGVQPHVVMPNAVRNALGVASYKKSPSKKQNKTAVKDAVLSLLQATYPDLASVWRVGKRGAFRPENYDAADAILTALYALHTDATAVLMSSPALWRHLCTNTPFQHHLKHPLEVTDDGLQVTVGSGGEQLDISWQQLARMASADNPAAIEPTELLRALLHRCRDEVKAYREHSGCEADSWGDISICKNVKPRSAPCSNEEVADMVAAAVDGVKTSVSDDATGLPQESSSLEAKSLQTLLTQTGTKLKEVVKSIYLPYE